MRNSEDLHGAFLEEMNSLENFRMTYAGMHPKVPIEREDPEVRRLLEAMALMTARTRVSALTNLLATGRRLFQQFFSFLLAPLPPIAMLEARTTGQFVDPVVLPRGTEVLITPVGGAATRFNTLFDMRLLPIRIERLETLLRPDQGFRVLVHFRAPFPRNDDIGRLSLHLNHMNDYQASLRVQDGIKKHLVGTSVWFDERVTEESRGTPCETTFGEPPSETPADPPHPLQAVRSFLHFPERELFLNIQLPPSPRNWRKFTVALDFDAAWPKGLRLNQDVLRLFAVPVVNLRRAMAQPLVCDGKQERYPIRFPDPAVKIALHSIVGVYEIGPKGLVPLRPGTLGGGAGSYEVERGTGSEAMRRAWVRLQLPEAFEAPKKIAIEANWFQPWSTEKETGKLAVTLYDRDVTGAQFEIAGDVRPEIENPLRDDNDALLTILALKHKTVLSLDEIFVLLNALGSVRQSPFRSVPELFASLEVKAEPETREQGSGIRYIYEFGLREFDPTVRPFVETVLEQLARALNAWVSGAVVTVAATIPGTTERVSFG